MSRQQWRKALWHLRNSGVGGLKDFRRKSKSAPNVGHSDQSDAAIQDAKQTDRVALSVVVPAFNASDHVDACLKSILAQKGVTLEVIVVDDGSTDDTVDRVLSVISVDERVSVLRGGSREGPARARNKGVDTARGTYITFADADDEVLPGAYSTMVDSLERTGSDIGTGSFVRIGKTGRSRPKLSARLHARQRLAVRLDDMPELLEEPVLWNKIYRREFWDRHVGEMHAYPNYEDQAPVYRALVGAASIDVLTEDVYAWRLADGRDTRSQRKAQLTDLQTKIDVIEVLRNTLEHAPERVLDRAYSIWMGTDLAMHAEFLGTACSSFRTTLCEAAKELRKSMPRRAWKFIPAQERLLMWVVATGCLDDVEEVLGTRAEETSMVPLEQVAGKWLVAPTYVDRLKTDIPRRLLRAHNVDFAPRMIIRNARWVSQQIIELQGCAYIPGIHPRDVDVHIQGVMDGSVIFDSTVEQINDNRIDLEAGDPWRSYATGGFRTRIDLVNRHDLSPRGIRLTGRFTIESASFQVPATSTAVAGLVAPSPVVQGRRVTVIADGRHELSIQNVVIPDKSPLAKRVACTGRDVRITLNGFPEVTRLTIHGAGMTVTMSAHGRSTFVGTLPELPEHFYAGGERTWAVLARMADGRNTPLHHGTVDYLLPETSSVRLRPNLAGAVWLTQRFRRVTVTGATGDRDRLLVTGRIDPPKKLEVVLKSSDHTVVPDETSIHADGSFTAVYSLTTTGSESGRVASMSGGYHVRYGDTDESTEGWARVADKLAVRPVDCYTEWNTIRVEGRESEAVALTASPPWSRKEQTKYGRFALRRRDWGPLQSGVVFESYNGKSANDNPRALFDEIREQHDDIPLYWSVRDRRVDVPEGGIPIVEGTADWHKALATSRVWINNNNFPYYIRKRPQQYYLQTWHGTPIKKLLWDLPPRKVPLTYRRLMVDETQDWNLLLAQTIEGAKNLRTGLGYRGKIKIMEYPRNVRLLRMLQDRASTRRRFNIPESREIILYAPTWRESDRNSSIINDPLLDLSGLAKKTGALIMIRRHHMTGYQSFNDPNVIDVSEVTNVEDILAVADALISDYSSIAYDYSITQRPIYQYVPDLPKYEQERGLYSIRKLPKMHRVNSTEEISDLWIQRSSADNEMQYSETGDSAANELKKLSESLIKYALEESNE